MSLYHLQKQYEEDNDTIMEQMEVEECDDPLEANYHTSREKKFPIGEWMDSTGNNHKQPAALIPMSASNIESGSLPNNGTPDSETEA